ncbi:hypothetical protein [Stappia sp. ES.058]|uniref:hypothetical protein n=1 Tax=Stappia sp. ES.058 TaxID=1881061 RepID=UPI00087AF2D2|nr:hypothetical protein [Stappia sp. ES.058]SDU30169.1 hypothetical protein SAMN05428979_2841 [Stappia sp. ES.058]
MIEISILLAAGLMTSSFLGVSAVQAEASKKMSTDIPGKSWWLAPRINSPE